MTAPYPTELRQDAFTRQVLADRGPRSAMKRQHWRTGREYFTRVPVQDCGHIHVRQIMERLDGEVGDHLHHAGRWALDWRPDQQLFTVRPLAQADAFTGVRVGLVVSLTGRGQGFRLWLECPHCARRCAALYASPWTAEGEEAARAVTGCRECLGLTDQNRQRHKCQDWASRVLGGQSGYGVRGVQTVQRARDIRVGGMRSLVGRMRARIKPGHPDVEALLDSLKAEADAGEVHRA